TGTTVVYGRGKMVVVNTGMNTEMGNIASMMEEEKGNNSVAGKTCRTW
ncbi:MAG TPA: hypothetical protein DHW87_03440, partial [Fervidobacterium sp.]|nr:hypothetical protein [Fervidobacterium sp.]